MVDQLFNSDGLLFTYEEFLAKYKFPIPPKEFTTVFGAVSPKICMLFKQQKRLNYQQFPQLSPNHSPIGKICFSYHCNNYNRSIRALFQKDVASKSNAIVYWNQFVSDVDWKKVWLLPNRYLLTNKVKEISFKLLHRIYPAKLYLTKFKKDIDVRCSFCKQKPETAVHLFWHCPYASFFLTKMLLYSGKMFF